jgi:DNA-binding NarL/FixJ family response regulator
MIPAFILADNQDITREGLMALLNRLSISEIIIEVSERRELIDKLTVFPNAAVILDYTLFDFSGMQLMNLRQRFPDSSWLLFSEDLSKHFLREILQPEPTFSVVMKTDPLEDIMMALRKMARRDIFLCDTAKQILREGVPTDSEHVALTTSERLVLHEIATGKTTKEIAYEQNLSFHTINTHRKNIFRKLGINNVHEAVKYALRAGIIDVAEYYM